MCYQEIELFRQRQCAVRRLCFPRFFHGIPIPGTLNEFRRRGQNFEAIFDVSKKVPAKISSFSQKFDFSTRIDSRYVPMCGLSVRFYGLVRFKAILLKLLL